MKKIRHLLGISGGKDSAALAIYMKANYPEIDMEYYFCDTGKELDETYELIEELENFLGKKIARWRAAENSPEDPFDHFLKLYGGYLPSNSARWCTKNLKLEPFENNIGDNPAISYVAIRGDENREGYVSTKSNIQTVFPFRKNIWSIDVLSKILENSKIKNVLNIYSKLSEPNIFERAKKIVLEPTSKDFLFSQKIDALLSIDISTFNHVVFEFLKSTDYPMSNMTEYNLLSDENVIAKQDVINLFKEYGVTYPGYYKEVKFTVNGETGTYARSRSGCYFCFYQQKIEWVWLYERHPDLFKKAMEYEKDGFTWNEKERLEDLIKPDRLNQIKEDHLKKLRRKLTAKTNKLIDVLDDSDGINCVNCFV